MNLVYIFGCNSKCSWRTKVVVLYNFWIASSDLSNDRRCDRHVVRVKLSKLSKYIVDLEDENMTFLYSKKKYGKKAQAQRHIFAKGVVEIYEEFKRSNPQLDCPSASVFLFMQAFLCESS